MKISRYCAGVVATLAVFAAADARAEGSTVILNTFQTVWIKAPPGPQSNGLPRIGKNTGAGAAP